ncbi:hypothetical protein C5N99_10600 [Treponema medium]|nr:hypothetical protein C5N99_10600 [Treponema medium]
MRKKWCGAFFLLILLPLCSESLRDQNKTYFDSIQWEALGDDLTIPPISEPYTIEDGRPIPYADTIDDGDILPSLPQLGILDYQNIPEDLLSFCDTITTAIVAKSLDSTIFSTQKAFLSHLGRFMIDHFPDFSYAFYGRPSFKQDGSAIILMRLAVKQVAVEVPNENQDAVIPQDATAQIGEPEQTPLPMETTESTNDTEDVKEGIEEMPENIADVPNLFSDNEQPLFIMMEFGAVKEDTVWKISYIDFKGAEYADSALTD